MKYTIGLAFLIISFMYSVILNILFFSKKRVKTKETVIFGQTVVINLIGIILETACIITANVLGKNNLLTILVNKAFLIYFLVFLFVFSSYVINAAEVSSKEGSIHKKIISAIKIFSYIILSLSTIGVILLDINLYCNDGITYSYGESVNLVYIAAGLSILGCILYLIINYKNINKSRNIPVIVFIAGMGIMTLIQKNYPEITLATSMETLVIFLMYHTIENPDIKVISELEIEKTRANAANQAKTDFLSSMSHEIRTPLNAIVGFSNCIKSSNTLEEAKENAKDIVDASNTLLEIVNGILDISKIEAGKLEIVSSPYNAKETFIELANLMSYKMKEKGLDFTYFIDPEIPNTLYGDYTNIKKIVTNLLSNAYKYTDKGFVKYEVNCLKTEDTTKLIISVEDSGRGIKKEDLDKLFNKFQRLEEDLNSKVEGTGLGLAITKQLTELMGGRIVVDTVYEQGSKFIVTLDQKIIKDEIVEDKLITKSLNLSNIKILLVDDNELNLKVGVKLLEKFNANNIDTVSSGYEAIEKVKNNEKYDLILLDIMMPKLSGEETLHELKSIEEFNTPVIALTANALTGMKEEYLNIGFDGYLSKPLLPEELIQELGKFTTKLDEDIEVLKEIEEPPVIDKKIFLTNNGVDINKALEFLGDMEMYTTTVNDYLQEAENKFHNLEELKLKQNIEEYAILVHSLKSDAKYLGLSKLADLAYNHELAAKENNFEYVNDNFEELSNEYEKTLNILKAYNDKF